MFGFCSLLLSESRETDKGNGTGKVKNLTPPFTFTSTCTFRSSEES